MFYASHTYVFEVMCEVYDKSYTSSFKNLFKRTRRKINKRKEYLCHSDQMLKKIYNEQIKKICKEYKIKLDEECGPSEAGNYTIKALPYIKERMFRRQGLEKVGEIADVDEMGIDTPFVIFKTKAGTSNLLTNYLNINYSEHVVTAIPTENAAVVFFVDEESCDFIKNEMGFITESEFEE